MELVSQYTINFGDILQKMLTMIHVAAKPLLCLRPSGRGAAYSGPCAEAFYKQAHCTSPHRGEFRLMCASVCMTEG